MSNKKRKKRKKNIFQKFTTVFIVFFVICIILWGGLYSVNYVIGEDEIENTEGSQNKVSIKKKDEINALVCGTNQTLTDTMLYVNYNVNTGKVAMMSIPRDTYINNK